MPLELIQTRINFAVVELLRAFTNRLEEQWLRVKLWVYTKDIQNNSGSRAIISTADDITVANDEHELSFVVVVEGGEGIDRATERIFTFGVTWYLAEDEFVEQFGCTLGVKL